jgi:type I restriction-modification system DNA methylase subunit
MLGLSISQLESYLWEAANSLSGPLDAADFKSYVFLLLFFKWRERAQSFLTDEHLQRVVRAYQEFKDEPGFTRVVPIEEIRAKEGNLSIPLYVGGETQAQTDAATETATTALPEALMAWIGSSREVRASLTSLLQVSQTRIRQSVHE